MRNRSIARPASPTLGALALALLLGGCSLIPSYQRPEAPIPEQWTNGALGRTEEVPMDTPSTTVGPVDWQTFVVDEALRALIERALANNRDLRQSILNVEVARAQYRVQTADQLPNFLAEGNGTRQRVADDMRTPGSPAEQSSYRAGIALASYELDLFGRVGSLSEEAMHEYLATEEAARSVRISLVAEVIHAYLTRDGAQQRHSLASRIQTMRENTLSLVEQRRKAGAANDLEVQEALGLVQQARVEQERVDREYQQADNALALLVGDASTRSTPTTQRADSAILVRDVAPGIPSELLVHRPDVRRAEHLLMARNANIGAARAAFFPSISLTGSFGSSSLELKDLFSPGQLAWSFMPQITLPIFDGGRNRANLDLAQLRKDIAIAGYERSIQEAFRDASDALVLVDTMRREESALLALVKTSTETTRLAEVRYRSGADDFSRYLDAQRSDLTNQLALVQVTTQRQIALATLFRALGGGWSL